MLQKLKRYVLKHTHATSSSIIGRFAAFNWLRKKIGIFCHAEVPISKEMYQNSWLIMWIFRVVGLFPLLVKSNRFGLFLKWSPWYAIYGYLLGVVLSSALYWVLPGPSIILPDIDQLMGNLFYTGFALVYLCASVINPSRFGIFFSYIKCLNQADAIIKTKHKKLENLKLLRMLTFTFILSVEINWQALLAYKELLKQDMELTELLVWRLPIFFGGALSTIAEYTNTILLKNLEKRIKKLNQLLKFQHVETLKVFTTNEIRNIRTFKKSKDSNRDIVTCEPITDLNKAYLAIIDAANKINDCCGPCIVTVITVVFWALIGAFYFFLLNPTAHSGGEFTFLFSNIFRVLLIIEPPYAWLVEFKVTKRLVCNLLSRNVNQRNRKQIRRFAAILELQPLKFSVYDLFDVDRLLITSLISNITTVLVISLQYREGTKAD